MSGAQGPVVQVIVVAAAVAIALLSVALGIVRRARGRKPACCAGGSGFKRAKRPLRDLPEGRP
jgi:hypothetical protein